MISRVLLVASCAAMTVAAGCGDDDHPPRTVAVDASADAPRSGVATAGTGAGADAAGPGGSVGTFDGGFAGAGAGGRDAGAGGSGGGQGGASGNGGQAAGGAGASGSGGQPVAGQGSGGQPVGGGGTSGSGGVQAGAGGQAGVPATPYTPPPWQTIVTPDGSTVVIANPPTNDQPSCIAVTGFSGGVAAIDLDTGAKSSLGSGAFGSVGQSSIGFAEGFVYYCDDNGTLARMPTAGGTAESAPVPCDSVAAQGSRLFVLTARQQRITVYRNFVDAMAERSERLITPSEAGLLMNVRDLEIFVSHHTGNEVRVMSTETGASLRHIALEGHDDAIHGLVVRGGELFVSTRDGVIKVFDATNGRLLRTLTGEGDVQGLACTGRNSAPPADGPPKLAFTCGGGGYQPSFYVSTERESPEVYIVGIYEGANGQMNVNVNRREPLILVLSAYAATTWNINAASGTNILRVLVNAQAPQTVNGPAGVAVDRYEGASALACMPHVWPLRGSCDARELRGAVSARTNRLMTGFGGCYSGASATID